MNILRALLLSMSLVVAAHAETVRVGAAISLKDALGDIVRSYESATGDHVDLTFGSSGQILAQIRNGADIDLFISAANKQVNDLAKEKLVDAATRQIVAANALVLIVPADAKQPPMTFEALVEAAVGKIAVGEPKTVPAGQYAQQVFQSMKLADAVAGKLVFGTNVRQVLTYVEGGEVAAGVVYATDAKEAGGKVRVVATAAEDSHEPIVYPAVVLTASKRPDAAKKFLAYLSGEPARAALAAKGFALPKDAAVSAGK